MSSETTQGCQIRINDIDITFPHPKPYDLQKEYMKVVLDCLQNGRHGVLESPTGTGKTLCLFAPLIAWLNNRKMKQHLERQCTDRNALTGTIGSTTGKVWYTSRTHAQIAQTISEARKCKVGDLSIRVMGAREQLCINPIVLKENESFVKTIKCKELVKDRKCAFFRRLDHEKHKGLFYQPGEIADIEDLVASGKKHGVCPYYMARIAKDQADVVLLPYNYIIDKDSRDSSEGTSYEGDIVIFDEGHNVPTTCEESYEFSFSTADIISGIGHTQTMMKDLVMRCEVADEEDEEELLEHNTNAKMIMDILLKLDNQLREIGVSDTPRPVRDLYSLFDKAGLTANLVSKVQHAVANFFSDSIKLGIHSGMLNLLRLIEKVSDVLHGQAIRTFDQAMIENSFKFYLTKDQKYGDFTDDLMVKKLSLFCFNPSFGIKDILLLGVKSLIITSGTLSPLQSFIYELSLPRPLTLENGHIADKQQVPFMILGTGVNNVRMDASFANRKNDTYKMSLGMTLTNLISSVPDGILLLFSSYAMLHGLQSYWERSDVGVWNRLQNIKRVFVEPRGKDEFLSCMENYRRAIDAGNGAVLMGVVRGKISEGMDFKDQYCRAVFIVGVPFPPVKDPKVKGKEKFAEELTFTNPLTNKIEKVYSHSYMSVEAMKATNQAIGRVIRHVNDYGSIVLIDYRFTSFRLFSNISKWLRNGPPQDVNFMTAKKALREFFKKVHLGELGVPEKRKQAVNSHGEPIATKVDFEEYDHKKAKEQITQAPWIAKPAANCSSMVYINDSEDEKNDLLKMYEDAKNSSVQDHADSATPMSSTRIEYLNIRDENLLKAISETSTAVSRKRKRTVVVPSSPAKSTEITNQMQESPIKQENNTIIEESDGEMYQDEAEGTLEQQYKMCKDYLRKVKLALSATDWLEFKTNLKDYKDRKSTFDDITPMLSRVLISKAPKQLLTGCRALLKREDRKKFDAFTKIGQQLKK